MEGLTFFSSFFTSTCLHFDESLSINIGCHQNLVYHARLRISETAGDVLLGEPLCYVWRFLWQWCCLQIYFYMTIIPTKLQVVFQLWRELLTESPALSLMAYMQHLVWKDDHIQRLFQTYDSVHHVNTDTLFLLPPEKRRNETQMSWWLFT